VSLSTHTADRPRKAEVGYFVCQLTAMLLEQDVLALNISVDKVFFVNALESFHDFDDDPGSLSKGKDLTG